MSQTSKSVRAALLAIAFFALVVAAAPRVLPTDVSGAADAMASQSGGFVVQRTAHPAV